MTSNLMMRPIGPPPSDLLARYRVAQTLRQAWDGPWACQMLAVSFVMLDNPEKAPMLLNAISSLDTIWTVGLSVLGIYVYKRSKEKQRSN